MRHLFHRLGTRLLITHILVALAVLVVVGIALLATVPPVQRALTFRRLATSRQASLLLGRQVVKLEQNGKTAQQQLLFQMLRDQAQAQDMRILLVNTDNKNVTFDSAGKLTDTPWTEPLVAPTQTPRWWRILPGNRLVRNQVLRGTLQLEGNVWFYVAGPMLPVRGAVNLSLIAMRERTPLWTTLRALTEEVPPVVFASILLAILAIIYLLSAWVASSVTRSLMPVLAGTQQIAAGNLDYRVPTNASSLREVALLARSFNRMAERVQQTQQAQRDFVANVSHDLKTPLTSIQGFAQALLDGAAANPATQARAAEIIHAEAQRLSRLVNELLEALNLDSGQLQLNQERLDLNQQLQDLLKSYTARSEGAGIKLLWQPVPTPIVVSADPHYLQRVFTNLLDNAFTYTPAGGQITVSTASVTAPDKTDSFAEVTVADTGKGIPAADLPHIFDRFYQVDKARSGKRGFGLGLSIVRSIVDAHGGAVQVESTLNVGSRFQVWLPLEA
ncbi:MAG: HAMP domain-containing sensor histidine kinase [Caldilineaceae bacterium]